MAAIPFPETLTVLHGAPLLHVPKGSRDRVVTLARTATEVAVGRGRDADMAPVHVPAHGHAFYERDGRLWTRVALKGSRLPWTPLTPGLLADILAGPGEPDDLRRLAALRVFARTPLSPRDRTSDRKVAFEAKRARGVDLPRGPGLVLRDGRDRCAEELRRFLAEEVLVTETSVYYATAPLVRASFDTSWRWTVDPCRTFEPRDGDVPPQPARGRHARIRAVLGPRTHAGRDDAPCVAALEAAGWLRRPEALGPSESRIAANALPGWIASQTAGWGRGRETEYIAADLRERLLDDAFLAMTGSIHEDEAPAVLARSAEALKGLAAIERSIGSPNTMAGSRLTGWGTATPLQERHLRTHLLPRLSRGSRPRRDDAEALGSLAP